MEGEIKTVKIIESKKTHQQILCEIAESAIIVDWVIRERDRVKNEIRVMGKMEIREDESTV